MEDKKKYYTNSAGESVEISTLETTHLTNALAKKYRELFESTSKEEYSKRLNEINDLKEDLYGRFNTFYEKLGQAEEVSNGK